MFITGMWLHVVVYTVVFMFCCFIFRVLGIFWKMARIGEYSD